MSLKDYAVMPYSDYEGACDAIREKDGSSAPIKSGELRSKILGIETGADVSVVTATAPDVLSGKVIVDKDGNPLTGSMPNNGAGGGTISKKAGSITIPEGYYDGSGKVSISSTEQSKIIAGNIKSGVSILGVSGSYAGPYVVISGTVKPTSYTTVTISNSAIKSNSSCKILGGCLYHKTASNVNGLILYAATSSSSANGITYSKLSTTSSVYGKSYSVYATKTSGTITMTIEETSSSYGFSTTISYNYCIAMSV